MHIVGCFCCYQENISAKILEDNILSDNYDLMTECDYAEASKAEFDI